MNLVIPDSSIKKINQIRKKAINYGLLLRTKDDYSICSLECNNKVISVKARLKGDHADHFKTDRWSYRIIALDFKILNHSKISVQGVKTRAYINEWVFDRLLEQEGLIHLQYEFFRFCMNNTHCGMYAFESHFDNYLLKMAKRKNGPLMNFDETAFWK